MQQKMYIAYYSNEFDKVFDTNDYASSDYEAFVRNWTAMAEAYENKGYIVDFYEGSTQSPRCLRKCSIKVFDRDTKDGIINNQIQLMVED